jgi:glutaminyl-peptide cyclotransferase
MKRYLIIGLVLLIIGSFVLVPLLKNNTPDDIESGYPASFKFEGELATTYGDASIPIAFDIHKEDIKTLELIYNDSIFQTWRSPKKGALSLVLDADYYGVGAKTLILRATMQDGNIEEDTRTIRILSDTSPKPLTAKVVTTFPHNPANYTQGFEFHNGELWESTGNPGNTGESTVGKIDMKTGQYIPGKKNALDATYFGEGITIFGDELFQLTWQNGKCFVYDKNTLQLKKDFTYVGEGWGLCNDGKSLIMSDGTERITFRDPKTFKPLRTIEVYDEQGPRIRLNELEYIDGKIYANIYMTSTIVVIEPNSGRVLEQIDATGLEAVGKMGGEVLNGIAYNPATKKLYLTGKNWGKIIEVALSE